MPKPTQGRIILPSGLIPEPHELATAAIFAKQGHTVEFIKPSRTKGQRSADIRLHHQLWEIKSPTGKSKRTIERQLQRALKQAHNIIIDGRRNKIDDQTTIKNLQRQASLSKSIRKLIYITKNGILLDINQKS